MAIGFEHRTMNDTLVVAPVLHQEMWRSLAVSVSSEGDVDGEALTMSILDETRIVVFWASV